MRKKGTFLLLLFFFLFAGWGNSPVAQFNDPVNEPGDGNQLDDPDLQEVPLDGGLLLLLAAGAGYGLKKYRSATRPKSEE